MRTLGSPPLPFTISATPGISNWRSDLANAPSIWAIWVSSLPQVNTVLLQPQRAQTRPQWARVEGLGVRGLRHSQHPEKTEGSDHWTDRSISRMKTDIGL